MENVDVKGLVGALRYKGHSRPALRLNWKGRVICFSIQGGEGAYCTPRERRESLLEYESVELAIFEGAGGGAWLTPQDVDCGPLYDHRNPYDDVMGWVPVETVVAGIEFLLANGATLVKPAAPKGTG